MPGQRAAPLVREEREGAVVTLTLDNRPRQFQDRELVAELDARLAALERDRSMRAVVITGAHPRSFITHYDVAEILASSRVTPDIGPRVSDAALRATAVIDRLGGRRVLAGRYTAGLLAIHRLHQLYVRMERMDKVIIAAINGTAAAGGCELALACDIRLMADGDFTIGLTEPVLGFNPGGGGGQRLARNVGAGRAVEMLLEARHYQPREAVEAGFVHRVVAADELLAEAHETARRLARRSRRAVWASKRAVYRGPSTRWPAGYRLDGAGFAWGAVADSTKRAMRLFLEQLETVPDGVPSPWHDPNMLRAWQDGEVIDFSS